MLNEEGVKISIIIPVYNTSNYLNKCLDSICNQTISNIEIIIVNDGSTDGSDEIIRDYAKRDNRIIVMEQVNKGVSAARNAGLSCASGNYVMFVDSDDWIDIDTCEEALGEAIRNDADIVLWSYMREYGTRPNKVSLFKGSKLVWNQNNIASLYRQTVGLSGEQLREPQKTDAIITAWGKLYRMDCIKGVSFVNTSIIGTEDALFNVYVFSKIKRAVYLPYAYSHYRKTNTASLTHHYKKRLVYQWRELYKRIEEHLNSEHAERGYYEALNNRIALGLIGLGLNLAEDVNLNFYEKKKELHHILTMPHYKKALCQLPTKYFPVHWKVFFFLARYRFSLLMLLLLLIMNRMRGL